MTIPENQIPNIPGPGEVAAVPTLPKRKPRKKPAVRVYAQGEETPAAKLARERREEIEALKHDDAVSGLQKKKWLRYLLVSGIVLLFAGFAAVVGVYLALAWKAGTPFDASIINGVFGVLKEGIGSMLGL